MAVQWAAPPPNAVMGGEKHTKWGEVAGMLRANQGQWAKVADKPSRTAAVALTNGISGGKRSEFEPIGHYVAAYAPSATDTTRYDVFAMYVGASANGNGQLALDSNAAEPDDDGFGDDPE